MFLHLSELGLGSVADFSNTGASASTSAECALLTHVKGDAIWM